MKSGQTEDGNDEDAYDHDGHDGHYALRGGQPISVVKHVHEAEDEYCRHVEREGNEKHEKVAVVAPADAVIHPGAVVIEYLKEGIEFQAW